MTRVIHTGDTHIGYQQYNTPERRRDFLEAFSAVADDAIAENVDALVHAGDLFHDRRPSLLDLQGTVEILRRLADADIPFLAVVGNHEGKRDAQWLDLFADLGLATRLGASPVVVDDLALYGLDFVPRSRREDLPYDFDPVPEDAEHTTLVSHGLFEPFAHADWDTETVLERSNVTFDAMLLGDNHAPDTAEVRGTWVTYCGSTERASASERDDRGYNLVTFESNVTISRRSVPDTREFVFVDVELGEEEGIDRVQERVREYDLEDAVVIVTVEGDGRPITPATVEELALERGALVARVNDRREISDTDDEVSVSFADPDAAVRKRVREMGLSNAALEIDETVRDSELADSNVREAVERRVTELLEADESAFAPAPNRDPDEVNTLADSLSEDADSEGDHAEEGASDVTPSNDGADTERVDDTDGKDTTNPADENDESSVVDESEDSSTVGKKDESGRADESDESKESTTSLGDFA